MATAEHISVDVRPVTEAEIDTYYDKGWAMLRGLISPELAAELLRVGKEKMGEDGSARTNTPDWDHNKAAFAKWYKLDEESELYRELRLNSQMGKNAALLMGQDMPVRTLTIIVACKLPHDLDIDRGKGVTTLHQDAMATPARCNSLAYWIALDEVTPEMGSMRFWNESNKMGILAPPLEAWPRLEQLRVTDDLHYQPGDATVHSSLVVHDAPVNKTSRSRWALIVNYFPGNAPYVPYYTKHTDGIEDELTPGKPLDHPRFPLVYTPGS